MFSIALERQSRVLNGLLVKNSMINGCLYSSDLIRVYIPFLSNRVQDIIYFINNHKLLQILISISDEKLTLYAFYEKCIFQIQIPTSKAIKNLISRYDSVQKCIMELKERRFAHITPINGN